MAAAAVESVAAVVPVEAAGVPVAPAASGRPSRCSALTSKYVANQSRRSDIACAPVATILTVGQASRGSGGGPGPRRTRTATTAPC